MRLAGTDTIDPDKVLADIERLKTAAATTKKYVNKRIAHIDRHGTPTVPTAPEIDAAVELIGELPQKYTLLLTAPACGSESWSRSTGLASSPCRGSIRQRGSHHRVALAGQVRSNTPYAIARVEHRQTTGVGEGPGGRRWRSTAGFRSSSRRGGLPTLTSSSSQSAWCSCACMPPSRGAGHRHRAGVISAVGGRGV